MRITFDEQGLHVPEHPDIALIAGDGIGPDVSSTGCAVIDAAVKQAYGGTRAIAWVPVLAGEAAFAKTGEWLPKKSLDLLRACRVGIKGPLTTPIGGGIRSLNVTIRQELDLYACVRPVKWYSGIPAPVKEPEKLDVVIFRENTEDVYAGIEWKAGSKEADKVITLLNSISTGTSHPLLSGQTGIGIKPISEEATKRIVRAAISYALQQGRRKVTIVHKGNIMKFTEGAFRDWAYEVAAEFPQVVIEGKQGAAEGSSTDRRGKPAQPLLVNDRIADAMFQQLLLRPDEYDVIVTSNLNGDYLSDACAAQVGGLGVAPGANINYERGLAVFEATHGTAPKYADLDKVNPGSFILSGVMMLEHLGWQEAAELIVHGLTRAIANKNVTYDLARQMDGATEVSCSGFGREIIRLMGSR